MSPERGLAHANVAAVSTTPTRVFVARLAGLPIFDPQGDQVGKVRDLVVALRADDEPAARARAGRRGVRPAPDLRADDPGHQHRQRQVNTTGLLNMRRFEQRPTETLVIGQMLDRTVTIREHAASSGTVYDVAMEQARNRDWVLSPGRRPGAEPRASGGKGQTHVVEWRDVDGPAPAPRTTRAPTHLIAALDEMRPADAANVIHDLPARAAYGGRRRPSTTSASPTCSRSCPRRTRSRSSSTSTPSAPPTSSRRCRPTTPPT